MQGQDKTQLCNILHKCRVYQLETLLNVCILENVCNISLNNKYKFLFKLEVSFVF